MGRADPTATLSGRAALRRKADNAYWAADVAIGAGADSAQTRAEKPGRRCQAALRVPEAPQKRWSVICITDQHDGKPYDTRVLLRDKFRGEFDWFENALGTASSCPAIRAGLVIGIYRGRNCVVRRLTYLDMSTG
jgi:hypothetical protein